MHVEHHALINEFPEHRAKIHALKLADHHAVRYFHEYEDVDKQICRAEEDIEPMSDDALKALKIRRLHLKDTIRNILVNEPS